MNVIRNIDEVELTPVDMPGAEGVSMRVMAGRDDGAPTFAMRQFRVVPGGCTPRHAHDYEHEVFILEGGGQLHLAGEDRAIKPGDVAYIPCDTEHQFRAGDGGLRFLCLSPVTRNCGEPTPGT